MNPIRSILIAGILIVVAAWSTDPVSAQAPHRPAGTPTRLATKQSSVGQLIRSRFTDVQLVSDEFDLDDPTETLELEEDEDLDPADEEEADGDDDEMTNDVDSASDDQKRQSSMATRLAGLKKRATEITIRVSADGATPQNRAKQLSLAQPMIAITALSVRPSGPDRYTTCFMHRPLYFEQRNLERCGNGHGCWQNSLSGLQFLGNTILLPYHLGQQRCDCTVPAGGDCKCCESFPCDCDPQPVDCRGLVTQAAAVAGFTFLLL